MWCHHFERPCESSSYMSFESDVLSRFIQAYIDMVLTRRSISPWYWFHWSFHGSHLNIYNDSLSPNSLGLLSLNATSFLLVLCFHLIIITEDKSSSQCCHDMGQPCAMCDTHWWYTLNMLVLENSFCYNFKNFLASQHATGITENRPTLCNSCGLCLGHILHQTQVFLLIIIILRINITFRMWEGRIEVWADYGQILSYPNASK